MSTSASKLKIKGVTKSYGSFVALAPTDLDVGEGECVTLLGPSGSGKSTLLMTVAGLTMPDSGEVWIDGTDATRMPSYRRDIGMMFQSYALFPHMSIFENIAFPLRMRKRPAKEIRHAVERALEVVRLPNIGGRLPSQLSGGQQQRIALARCLVYRPSIILMDEPLGALDKKLRQEMQFEIKRIHEEIGITLLWVTHDQEEALLLSDRICLMNGGRIEQIGSPREIYSRPATPFVADFIGESNLVEATVVASGGGTATVHIQGMSIAIPTTSDHEAGSTVRIVLRPEDIVVATEDADRTDTLAATVMDIIFLGDLVKYRLRLANSQELLVKLLRRQHADTLAIGSRVGLSWPSSSCVLV